MGKVLRLLKSRSQEMGQTEKAISMGLKTGRRLKRKNREQGRGTWKKYIYIMGKNQSSRRARHNVEKAKAQGELCRKGKHQSSRRARPNGEKPKLKQ